MYKGEILIYKDYNNWKESLNWDSDVNKNTIAIFLEGAEEAWEARQPEIDQLKKDLEGSRHLYTLIDEQFELCVEEKNNMASYIKSLKDEIKKYKKELERLNHEN